MASTVKSGGKKKSTKKILKAKRVSAYNLFVSRRRKQLLNEIEGKREAEKVANDLQNAMNAAKQTTSDSTSTSDTNGATGNGSVDTKSATNTSSTTANSSYNVTFGILMRQISDEWTNKISSKEKNLYERMAAVENLKLKREFNEMKRQEFIAKRNAKVKKRAEEEAARQKNNSNPNKKKSKKKS